MEINTEKNIHNMHNAIQRMLDDIAYVPTKEFLRILYIDKIINEECILVGEEIKLDTRSMGIINNLEDIFIPKVLSISLIKLCAQNNKGLIFIHNHPDFKYLADNKKKYWEKKVRFSDMDMVYMNSFVKVYNKYIYSNKNFCAFPIAFVVINEYSYQAFVWKDNGFSIANIEDINLEKSADKYLIE